MGHFFCRLRETNGQCETVLSVSSSRESDTSSERAWIDAARRGDQQAFAELFDLHARAVYWTAVRVLRSENDAHDVTQEVFILAWAKLSSLRVVDNSILPWLLVTSRNLSMNRVRELRREGSHFVEDRDALLIGGGAFSDEAHVKIQLLGEAIDDAVAHLSATDRALYFLCIEEGVSYSDAALRLGSTHGGIRNRLSRVRKRLQSALAQHREELQSTPTSALPIFNCRTCGRMFSQPSP